MVPVRLHVIGSIFVFGIRHSRSNKKSLCFKSDSEAWNTCDALDYKLCTCVVVLLGQVGTSKYDG
jgi:hypothetical protein